MRRPRGPSAGRTPWFLAMTLGLGAACGDPGSVEPGGLSTGRFPVGRAPVTIELRSPAGPVPGGVAIRLHAVASLGSWHDAHVDATTDATGRASFHDLEGGSLEIVDAAWRLPEGPRIPVWAGPVVEVDVVPSRGTSIALRDATGPLVGWRVSSMRSATDGIVATTDRQGIARLEGNVPHDFLSVGGPGARAHAFVLARPLRSELVELFVPPPRWSTRLLVQDDRGRRLPGAVGHVSEARSGITVLPTDGADLRVDYGIRLLGIVVSVAGYSPRLVNLEGEPELPVQLTPSGTRRFRVQGPSDALAADGTRVRLSFHGPKSYPRLERPRLTTREATTRQGVATFDDVPLVPVDVTVQVVGPGLHSIRTLTLPEHVGDDVVVTAAPGHEITLDLQRADAGPSRDPSPEAVTVLLDAVDECDWPVDAAVRTARRLSTGSGLPAHLYPRTTLFYARGPKARIVVPDDDLPRCLRVVVAPDWAAQRTIVRADLRATSLRMDLTRVELPDEPELCRVLVLLPTGEPAQLVPIQLVGLGDGALHASALADGRGHVYARPGLYELTARLPTGEAKVVDRLRLHAGRDETVQLR